MSDKYIRKLYNEINETLEGDYKIIIEPGRSFTEDWIEYDQVKWELEQPIKDLVEKLKKEKDLSFEEKILKVYEEICLYYIYDDNVLFFFRKDTSDINNIKYIAVDWYGRIVGEDWIENRKKHNRRICYEFSRLYAKAINELIDNGKDLEAVMIGDKDNTHYFVGLTGEECSAFLDLDDFNKIKDLTRLKLGLKIDGIRIIRDENDKFRDALNSFNVNRLDELAEVEELEKNYKKTNFIDYLSAIIKILNKYNIDSQGFMEYMRAKVVNEDIDPDKIWREIKNDGEKRHVRCLVFNLDSKTYIIDTVDKMLNEIKLEDLDQNIYILKPEEHEYAYYGG